MQTRISNIVSYFSAHIKKYPIQLAISIYALFFLVQWQFLITPDQWAEVYAEYYFEALHNSWIDIFRTGWAGYYSVIPTFFAELGDLLNIPVQHIGLYYRGITIAFSIFCLLCIAHPWNRAVINNDWLRIIFGLFVLFSLRHVSVFAYINIWYIGLFIIALTSMNPRSIPGKKIGLTIYILLALAIILSKPSTIVIPFLLYRLVHKKEYLAQSVLLLAAVVQTYMTIFSGTGFGNDLHTPLLGIISDIILAPTIFLMKFFGYTLPLAKPILILSSVIIWACITQQTIKHRSWLLLSFVYGLAGSVYLYLYAPDAPLYNLWDTSKRLLNDSWKLQREILIYAFLIGIIIIIIDNLWAKAKTIKKIPILILILIGIGMASPFKTINTTHPSLAIDNTAFLNSLGQKKEACMPIAPTPLWDPAASWMLQYQTRCKRTNIEKTIVFETFDQIINTEGTMIRVPQPTDVREPKTISALLKEENGSPHDYLLLENMMTKKTVVGRMKIDAESNLTYVVFDLGDADYSADGYTFMIKKSNNNQGIYSTGKFTDGTTVIYPYYKY